MMPRAEPRGKVADYIPELAKVDPTQLRHRGRHGRRRGLRRRRCRDRLLDPEHLQGLHADAGARQGRRRPVEAGRARAVGHRLQLDRPARARAGMPRNPFINAGAIVVSRPGPGRPRAARRRSARSCGSCAILADDETIAIDHEVARSEAADRLPQFRARQFHALLRQAATSGRAGARRLFPPMRAGDELPPARQGRPVPGRGRAQSADRAAPSSRASGRGASMR